MENQTGRICCFTGHRRIEAEDLRRLPGLIDVYVEKLIALGVTVFRAGGAVGFDTLAALKVIEKKTKYPGIRLELCLPCKNQAEEWNDRSRGIYDFILSSADAVHYESEKYTKSCMFERNRRLVRGSDFCLCYCSPRRGGSSYTLKFAWDSKVQTINLYDILKNDTISSLLN